MGCPGCTGSWRTKSLTRSTNPLYKRSKKGELGCRKKWKPPRGISVLCTFDSQDGGKHTCKDVYHTGKAKLLKPAPVEEHPQSQGQAHRPKVEHAKRQESDDPTLPCSVECAQQAQVVANDFDRYVENKEPMAERCLELVPTKARQRTRARRCYPQLWVVGQ
mmetsp:Transcript_14462/g.21230  ORF Transcript_14462/g.21230 Transcript_14462/m.21230 type:complete len:162 (+) Transcript_14462:1073-1558(+)